MTTAFGTRQCSGSCSGGAVDGKIVVTSYSFGTNNVFALVRYHGGGSLDTPFLGDGQAQVDLRQAPRNW